MLTHYNSLLRCCSYYTYHERLFRAIACRFAAGSEVAASKTRIYTKLWPYTTVC